MLAQFREPRKFSTAITESTRKCKRDFRVSDHHSRTFSHNEEWTGLTVRRRCKRILTLDYKGYIDSKKLNLCRHRAMTLCDRIWWIRRWQNGFTVSSLDFGTRVGETANYLIQLMKAKRLGVKSPIGNQTLQSKRSMWGISYVNLGGAEAAIQFATMEEWRNGGKTLKILSSE